MNEILNRNFLLKIFEKYMFSSNDSFPLNYGFIEFVVIFAKHVIKFYAILSIKSNTTRYNWSPNWLISKC